MRGFFRYTRRSQPQGGLPPLDINKPIVQGITSVVVPGIGRIDVAGGVTLSNFSGGATPGASSLGKALMLTANQAAIYTTATAAQRSASGSILWAGDLFASPSGDACLGGITNNSANTSPYVMMELKRNYSGTNASRIYFSLSTGGVVNNNNLSSSANYASGTGCIFIGCAQSGDQRLYSGKIGQGVTQDAGTTVSGSLSSSSTSRLEVGDSLNARNPQAACAIQITWNRALTATEAASLGLNPWQVFAPDAPLQFAAAVASSGVSGTIAWTEADDTATLTGTATVSGSVAWTEANDTATITGTATASAALAWTEADDTATITGTVTNVVNGSLSWTEADDTASISATATASGALSWTEANDTATVTGTLQASGALAWTEADDTLSITGSVTAAGTVAASLAWTEADDTLVMTGQVQSDQPFQPAVGQGSLPGWTPYEPDRSGLTEDDIMELFGCFLEVM